MKKCCFIVPYFGKLPKHFNVFLKTCEKNKNYDWLIFSDDNRKYDLPENVKIISITFKELKKIVQSKFEFNVLINTPYKLCDYKPAYGYIFENYIPYNKYRFWGHCDLDTIMGKLDNFLSDDILEKYDKLFCLGHMILYKNTYENNRIFMNDYKGRKLYKESFENSEITVFDEFFFDKLNIDSLFLENKKNIYCTDLSLNLKSTFTKFIRTRLNFELRKFEDEDYKKAVYIWNEGELYRLYIENDQLKKEEFLYAHFQHRNMKVSNKILNKKYFKILPNIFTKLEFKDITIEKFRKINKNNLLCIHYLEIYLINKFKRLWKKIKNEYIK